MSAVDYQTTKTLAEQRGLEARRLFSALNWYARMGVNGVNPEAASAIDGSAWTVRRGKIWWVDREDPNRFVLASLYERAI